MEVEINVVQFGEWNVQDMMGARGRELSSSSRGETPGDDKSDNYAIFDVDD